MTSTPRPPPREPLTPEEREMATRLVRLGPHEGPSAALDARILAAAHAATRPGAMPRRRGMRRVLALPAGWLTGAGLAASMALVLGVVWQLRPPQAVVAERGEAPEADGGFVPAKPVPSGQPRVLAPAAPPAESADLASAAERIAAPQARKRTTAAPPPAPDVSGSGADRPAEAVSDVAAAVPAVADSAALPAPPPAATVAAAPQAAAESAAAPVESAEALGEQTPQRRHSYTTSARAASASMAESRALRQATARDATRESAAMAPAAAAPPADGLTPGHPPSDWFVEIRRLRDEGEIDAARALLERFVEAHPSRALPDDLRQLRPAASTAP